MSEPLPKKFYVLGGNTPCRAMQKLSVKYGIILLCGKLLPVRPVPVKFICWFAETSVGEYGLAFVRDGATPTGEGCGGIAPVGRPFIE